MSTINLCGIRALFGIFFETNKHQNLARLGHPIWWIIEGLEHEMSVSGSGVRVDAVARRKDTLSRLKAKIGYFLTKCCV